MFIFQLKWAPHALSCGNMSSNNIVLLRPRWSVLTIVAAIPNRRQVVKQELTPFLVRRVCSNAKTNGSVLSQTIKQAVIKHARPEVGHRRATKGMIVLASSGRKLRGEEGEEGRGGRGHKNKCRAAVWTRPTSPLSTLPLTRPF